MSIDIFDDEEREKFDRNSKRKNFVNRIIERKIN